MRAIHLIPASMLLACGPAAPPVDGGSTTALSSSGSTTGSPETPLPVRGVPRPHAAGAAPTAIKPR